MRSLEATLALWAEAPSRGQFPVYRMLTMTVEEIDRRARALADRLSASPAIRATVVDGASDDRRRQRAGPHAPDEARRARRA